MPNEEYYIGIEIDSSLYRKSLAAISSSTDKATNDIAASIDKVVSKLGSNVGVDKFAASLAKMTTEAKKTKAALGDINNLAQSTGIKPDQILGQYKKLESEKTNAMKKAAKDREAVLNEELKIRMALNGKIEQEQRRSAQEAERIMRYEQRTRLALLQEQVRQEARAAREREKAKRDREASYSTLGTQGLIGGAAIIGGLALATNKSAEFEQSMAKVGAKADATAAQLKALKDESIKLTQYGFNTKQITEMNDTLASMGFDAQKIMDSMRAVAVSARASGSELNDVAGMIAKTLTVYQMSANKAMHVADVLAMADIKSAANLQTMYYAMNYAAAPAKTLGISLEELSASIMMLSNAGFRAETIGTSLKSGFIDLVKNEDKLKKIGITIRDNVTGNMKSFADIIDILNTRIKNLSGIDKLKVLSTFLPKTAIAAWVNLINQGGGQLREYAMMLQEVDGASEKLANTIQDNLMGDIQKLQGGFDRLIITGGGSLSPTLRLITQAATGLLDKLNNTNSGFTGFVTAATAGAGAALLFGGAIFSFISTLAQLKTAMLGLGFASLLNPLTAGVTIFSVLTGVVVAHIAAQKQLKDSVMNTTDAERQLNQDLQNNTSQMLNNSERVGDLFNAFTKLAKSQASSQEKLNGLMKLQTTLGTQFPELATKMNAVIEQYRNQKISVEQLTGSLRSYIATAMIAARTKIALENVKKAEKERDSITNPNLAAKGGLALNAIGNYGKEWWKQFSKTGAVDVITPYQKATNRTLGEYSVLATAAQKKVLAMNEALRKANDPKQIEALKKTIDFLMQTGSAGGTASKNQSLRDAGFSSLVDKKGRSKKNTTEKAKTPYETQISAFEAAVGREREEAADEGREVTNQRILELFQRYVSREKAIQNQHLKQKDDYDKRLGALKAKAIKTRLSEALVGFETDTADMTSKEKYQKYTQITDALMADKNFPLLQKQIDKINQTKKQLKLKADEEELAIDRSTLDKKINLYQLTSVEIYQSELDLVNKKIALYSQNAEAKKLAEAEAEKTDIVRKELERQYQLTTESIDRKKKLNENAVAIERQAVQFAYDMGRITDKQKILAMQVQAQKEYNIRKNAIREQMDLIRSSIVSDNPSASEDRINQLLQERKAYIDYKDALLDLDAEYSKASIESYNQLTLEKTKLWRQFTSSMKDSYTSNLSELIQGNATFADAFDQLLVDLNKAFSDMLAKWIVDWLAAQSKMIFTGGNKNMGASAAMGGIQQLVGSGSQNGGSHGGFTSGISNAQSGGVDGVAGGATTAFSQIGGGWKSMLNMMRQHQGLFVTGALGAWAMLAQGSTQKWALMTTVAYAAIRAMFVAFRNAKAKEAWIDAFKGAASGWASGMAAGFPMALVTAPLMAAQGFAFPAAKAAAITAMSFDVGTMSVPQDMLAQVHKGEVIVPERFSDKARRVLTGQESTKTQETVAPNVNLSYNVSMIDASNAQSFIDKHGDYMAKTLGKIYSGANLNRKTIRR